MGLFGKTKEPHVWSKSEVNIEELKTALEGGSSAYQHSALKKISKGYLKFEKRGVSNLYLIKEADDEGTVCATYAFSIISEAIDDELLASIRDAAMTRLSVGEMRAASFAQDPDEWWEQDTEVVVKRVNRGKPDGFMDLLIAELSPKGVIFTERQVKKVKLASELECSAVAWGIKERGLRKGVKNRVIQNEYL